MFEPCDAGHREHTNDCAARRLDAPGRREKVFRMGVIAWIILGLAVGLIADHIMGSPHGLIVTTVIGIVGALLGGWVASNVFHVPNLRGFFNLSTWLTALAGAIALLALLRLAGDRRLTAPRRRHLWH